MRARYSGGLNLCLQAAACITGPAYSAEISVQVLDQNGAPVADVAVYAEPSDGALGRGSDPLPLAVMDQVDSAFVPHILVIQTGTEVRFPNNDAVSHHVYSFSSSKRFELDLYRGNIHPPQLFDQPGLVVLGCNIHDSMLGFILVLDTPHFGKTDRNGVVTLTDLPYGSYRVSAWTPRTSERNLPAAHEIMVQTSELRELTFRFAGKLQPAHSVDPSSLEWKHY